MTLEEIKEELLKNPEQQYATLISATFCALYEQLIKKGIFSQSDIDEINKASLQINENLNVAAAKKIFETLNTETEKDGIAFDHIEYTEEQEDMFDCI